MRNDNRGGRRDGGHTHDKPQANYKAMTEYYDEEGRLKREVFVDWPMQIAKSIQISRTNLRRAYDFVAAMKFRIQMGEDAVSVLQPGMGQLHRFVHYQAGRGGAWKAAKNFFQAQINKVGNDPKNFEGFYQLFQSVMAYLDRSENEETH